MANVITRIYVDNFRPLVNFEWRPEQLALLLGTNGTGKSVLIEAVMGVRDLIVHQTPVGEAFPLASRTRWEQRLETRVWCAQQRPRPRATTKRRIAPFGKVDIRHEE